MSLNIHATCVNINSKGILILGDSGSGKSDLALRLITMFSAKLVSDDRTDIFSDSGAIKAKAPNTLKGLLEVRGIGIIKQEYLKETTVDLVIKLTADKIERMLIRDDLNDDGVDTYTYSFTYLKYEVNGRIGIYDTYHNTPILKAMYDSVCLLPNDLLEVYNPQTKVSTIISLGDLSNQYDIDYKYD